MTYGIAGPRRRKSFKINRLQQHKKNTNKTCKLPTFCYLLLVMSNLTYPATPEEFEEYHAVMSAMADEVEASTPDPEPTRKTYVVTFRDTKSEGGHKFANYPIRVQAFDPWDAQEKAIDSLESINMKHGAIASVTRSLSQL